MAEGRLYIGNRRYSSWSMRGWLAVKLAGLDVEEVMIHFARPGPTEAITKLSPNGLVPYLEHRGARVWELLAVCEYCAEITPSLWPADPAARAHARAISAEMHAGFTGIRQSMWMNLGAISRGWVAPRRHWPTSPVSRRCGRTRDSASVPAGRSCSARRSPRPMRCMRRW